MEEIRKAVAEQDTKNAKLQADLQKAELDSQELCRSLAPKAVPSYELPPGGFDGARAAFSLFPQDVLDQLGQSRESALKLLGDAEAAHKVLQERRVKEAADEASRIAAETAAAVAAKTEQARVALGAQTTSNAGMPGGHMHEQHQLSIDEAVAAMDAEADELTKDISPEAKRSLATRVLLDADIKQRTRE